MGGLVALGVLVIAGIILADVWRNPGGVTAASAGIKGIETPALNGLLGKEG